VTAPGPEAPRLRALFYCIFAVSGFSGLIYESIWSHYLKLYLGHAAYAQVLVLAIFMGGMSAGAWLAARYSRRMASPILVYAVVEGVIGVMGMAFHGLFVPLSGFILDTVLPGVDSAASAQFWKWATGAALILPQSILLGATFPLLSAGLLRRFPHEPGRLLGMLYFTNCIGGAAGVLVSGFVLIRLVGLPGTIMAAGVINILLAIVVYRLAREVDQEGRFGQSAEARTAIPLFLLGAAFITGLASFVYEIAWIRMLSMVLGASTHSFELMLSAFITGLAFGGLWIRRRIVPGRPALLLAAWVQILMGLFAFATIPLYNLTFDFMAWLMSGLGRNDAGYLLFTLGSHLIALAVMLPATFLAGMTLPLFTAILLDRGWGERSIGHVYAANTLGAIIGVFATLFILLPRAGIEGAMLLGSGLDVLLGIGFLVAAAPSSTLLERKYVVRAAAAVVYLAVLAAAASPDPRRMASGVYRYARAVIPQDAQVLVHRDGATASISVLEYADGSRTILTNGKPDAAMNLRPGVAARMDEDTMVLLGALPLALRPGAQNIAVIGFGSGVTTHVLLASPRVERVDTVEIEKFMYQSARLFEHRSERAFSDPRSRVFFEDARTFFHHNRHRYDLIVSEPSNPWVSGIAGLFSVEFYGSVRRFLAEDGLFVQWLHAYEINDALVYSVLKALAANFPDFHVYAANNGDLIVAASGGSRIGLPGGELFGLPEMRAELERIRVRSAADLRVRFLADRNMLEGHLARSRVPVNSDYFPYLDLNAARSRFRGDSVTGIFQLRTYPVPVLLHFHPELYRDGMQVTRSTNWRGSVVRAAADELLAESPAEDSADGSFPARRLHLELLRSHARTCDESVPIEARTHALLDVLLGTAAFLDGSRLAELRDGIKPDCDDRPAMHAQLLDLFDAYARGDPQAIAESAGALLNADFDYRAAHAEFLLGSLLLGKVAGGDPTAAAAAWQRHADTLKAAVPYPLELLRAVFAAPPAP
jgi:spermidine synthase